MTKTSQRYGMIAVVLGLVASATPVAAASASDFAVGGGNNTAGFFQLGLAAHSGAAGEDPFGHVSARSRPQGGFPAPFRFGGKVTCLRVVGNQAAIKYRFDQSDNPALVGGGIEIFVQDNGPPGATGPADQTASSAPMPPPLFDLFGPDRCDDPTLAAYSPVQHGNFVVHDDLG